MAFSDAVALYRARLGANLPQASLSNQSLFIGLGQAFLSADADTQALITALQPGLFLLTATDKALDRKAADYGVVRDPGAPATCSQLTFSLPPGQVASTPVSIPGGTLVATVGDGFLTASVVFSTDANAVITVGSSSVDTTATATTVGVQTNVAANTLVVSLTSALGGTLVVTNPVAATGGRDPQSDVALRSAALATLASKYSPTAVQDAVLAVGGVFDAYVDDPQDGLGHLFVYWCDQVGAQPGLSGQDAGAMIAAGTLADQVNQAVLTVLPPTVLAYYRPFTVFDVTVAGTYMASPTIASPTIEPQIQEAVVDFINSLRHGQAVVPYLMVQAVARTLAGSLLDFVPTISPIAATSQSTTPVTTLFRYPALPATIGLTRL